MEIEEFLYNYLNNPDRNKSIIPEDILTLYKTMPKVEISEDEAEALAIYLFDIGRDIIKKHIMKIYPTYKEALEVAKRENKIVMIEGFITYCRGCIKMDREVFIDKRVKEALEKDFVVTKINVLGEKLPLGLKSLGTPSFYFIANDGERVIDEVVGTGSVEEFLELLEDIKAENRKISKK
jgi:thiol:disulfide interchange protein